MIPTSKPQDDGEEKPVRPQSAGLPSGESGSEDAEVSSSRNCGPRTAGAPTLPRTLRSGDEDWVRALRGGEDRVHPSLRAEMGAALERQLLLASSPDDGARVRPSALPRGFWRGMAVVLVLSLFAGGVFLFLAARRTWEGKLSALETRMTAALSDAASRESALTADVAEKARELTEKKAELRGQMAIAERSLVELKTALDDLRGLRGEKTKLEAEYRELLRSRSVESGLDLAKWIPRWVRRASRAAEPSSQGPADPPAD